MQPVSGTISLEEANALSDVDYEALGRRIREGRVAAGNMKQKDLARHLGVTQTTISSYENARTRPEIGDLLKLSTVLRKPLTWLILGEEAQPTTDPTVLSELIDRVREMAAEADAAREPIYRALATLRQLPEGSRQTILDLIDLEARRHGIRPQA